MMRAIQVWSLPTYAGGKCYALGAQGNGCVSPEFLNACVNTGAYFLKLDSAFAADFLDQNLDLRWSDVPAGYSTVFTYEGESMPEQCVTSKQIADQCTFAYLFEQNPAWYGRVACVGASTPPKPEKDVCETSPLADLQQVNTNAGGTCPLFMNCIRGTVGDDVDKFSSVEKIIENYALPLPVVEAAR